MISVSRILFTVFSFLLAYNLVSCVDDEEVRLTTNVAVEGTEMFNASFALSEHLNLLAIPFERYADLAGDTLSLPGCPTVAVNVADRKVDLTFRPTPPCPNSNIRRTGSISLHFTNSLITNEETIVVEYVNYTVRNTRLLGSRFFTKVYDDGLENYKDRMVRLMVYDEFGSSTRISAEYEHHLRYEVDTAYSITTTGAGGGRNLAGRSFTYTITTPKVQYSRCVQEGIFVPSMGRESWTYERTVSSAVTHTMNFGETSECDRNVSVSLSNGETITLNP